MTIRINEDVLPCLSRRIHLELKGQVSIRHDGYSDIHIYSDSGLIVIPAKEVMDMNCESK